MKKLLLAAVFMLVAQIAMAQDATFKPDVVKLLELSGATTQFELSVGQLVKSVPVEKQADFKKDLKESLKGLIDKIADVYMTEFTHDDVKQMIKYYESPIGKKQSSKTAVLFEKGQVAGQEWAMGLQSIMMKYME
jgi:hypothetical protein